MSSRLGTIVLLVMWIAQVVCVAPLAEVAAGPNRVTVWMQVENWQALIAHQVQRLALGQRCGRGRGRGRCIRRVRRHRCRRRQEEVVWHRLKPVLEELVKEEVGDQRDKVSSFRLPVQIVVVTPDYDQTLCPNCGGATKCKRSYHSHP